MPNFNRVILVGHLTRDVEMQHLPSGTTVADIGLAVNRKWNGGDEVSYFNATAFGRTAEVVTQYCRKGDPILIEGYLKQDRWEDRDGNRRTAIKVIVDSVQFLGRSGQAAAAPAAPPAPEPAAPEPPVEPPLTDDDIPF